MSNSNGPRLVAKLGESGADELRRMVRVLASCRESALDEFTSEQLIQLQRAVWASEWDVYVDDLSPDQCAAVLERSEVPAFFDSPRGLVPVPSSFATAAEVHEWLHHDGGVCGEASGGCSAPIDEERAMVYRCAQRVRAMAARKAVV